MGNFNCASIGGGGYSHLAVINEVVIGKGHRWYRLSGSAVYVYVHTVVRVC